MSALLGCRKMTDTLSSKPFNSSLETGIRALIVLVASYPQALDLQRMVDYDYLVVHSGDVGGPDSLHPPLPMRASELLVRREIIEAGLLLMMSKGLVVRLPSETGIRYMATDSASPFVASFSSKYLKELQHRAMWAIDEFGSKSSEELREIMTGFFDSWTSEFHPIQGLGFS